MDSDTKTRSPSWQPLTFGGVASFSHAPFSRFFLVTFAFVAMTAATVVILFYLAWEPALRKAIVRLPEEGAVRSGQIDWKGQTPVRLAEGNFLSIVVDLDRTGELGYAADLQCEIGRNEFRLRSMLGYVGLPYPTHLTVPLNRHDLEPWWGAWHPVVAAGLAVIVVLGLFVAWTIVGAFYALPVQLIAYYADRQISVFGAWRLAVAALMPGTLLMSAALLAYSFQRLNLIQLVFAWVVHFALGWVYVVIAPMCLPRQQRIPGAQGKKSNPFGESSAGPRP